MIVPTMNSREILNEILIDVNAVQNKADSIAKNLRRSAIKSKSKTSFKFLDYKSPRKNDWVILLKSTTSYCSTLTCVHYLNKMGFNCLLVSEEDRFHHLSGHFLERYNERFLHQFGLSKLELFKHFILHNSIATIEGLNSKDINIKRIIIKFKHGIAFGTLEIINGHEILDYRTFISSEMVLAFQKENVDSINNMYDEFCNKNLVDKKLESF